MPLGEIMSNLVSLTPTRAEFATGGR